MPNFSCLVQEYLTRLFLDWMPSDPGELVECDMCSGPGPCSCGPETEEPDEQSVADLVCRCPKCSASAAGDGQKVVDENNSASSIAKVAQSLLNSKQQKNQNGCIKHLHLANGSAKKLQKNGLIEHDLSKQARTCRRRRNLQQKDSKDENLSDTCDHHDKHIKNGHLGKNGYKGWKKNSQGHKDNKLAMNGHCNGHCISTEESLTKCDIARLNGSVKNGMLINSASVANIGNGTSHLNGACIKADSVNCKQSLSKSISDTKSETIPNSVEHNNNLNKLKNKEGTMLANGVIRKYNLPVIRTGGSEFKDGQSNLYADDLPQMDFARVIGKLFSIGTYNDKYKCNWKLAAVFGTLGLAALIWLKNF